VLKPGPERDRPATEGTTNLNKAKQAWDSSIFKNERLDQQTQKKAQKFLPADREKSNLFF
jgi:hypothetical protein